MTTNNIAIIANRAHPLFDKLSQTGLPLTQYMGTNTILPESDIIFDFTLLEEADKIELLTSLSKKQTIISDLSTLWGELFADKFTNIKGVLGAAFWSPKNACEVYLCDANLKEQVDAVLERCELKAIYATTPGHGFIYPRTISLLINEAYLALEDELAEEKDLDTAMKFGVNYPLGLLEWSRKIGFRPVINLLDSLHATTKQERYRASVQLRKLAYLES